MLTVISDPSLGSAVNNKSKNDPFPAQIDVDSSSSRRLHQIDDRSKRVVIPRWTPSKCTLGEKASCHESRHLHHTFLGLDVIGKPQVITDHALV